MGENIKFSSFFCCYLVYFLVMEDVHYGEKGIEEQRLEGVHVCKREKGGDSYCNLILNSHEEMCGITSARGSGSCEQEATQKQRRRVTFLSLN